MRFRRRAEPDLRRLVRTVSRRERHLGWVRDLPSADLDRLVAAIERDLMRNPDRDSLLEHLARLHFDTTARARSAGRRALVGDTDTARCAIESVLFERRYGEPMLDALGSPDPLDDGSEAAHLYVEGAFRRLGPVVHLPRARALGDRELVRRRAPAPLPAAARARRVRADPARARRGSRAALRDAADRERRVDRRAPSTGSGRSPTPATTCACADASRPSTWPGPDLAYVLNSVFALAEAHREEL